MMEKLAEFMKKYGLASGIFFLAALFAANIFLLPSHYSFDGADSKEEVRFDRKNILRLSEMKGPSIDGGGVSIVREEVEERNSNAIIVGEERERAILPVEIWVLILAEYLFLLIFNLGFTFGRRNTVQWFWETAYTVLALASWFLWGQSRTNIWFPLYVMALGVLIYLFYLYFFWEKQKLDSQKSEKI
jgi:hypothetical protein